MIGFDSAKKKPHREGEAKENYRILAVKFMLV